MKTQTKLFILLAAVLALTTIGCGGGGGSSSPAPAATALGTSCGANMLQSQYGCLPQCGVSSVIYNNSCIPVTGVGGYPGATGYPGYPGTAGYPGTTIPGYSGYGTTGNPAMCQGSCPAGLVSIQGGFACLPQGTCGPCYGQYGSTCYIGDYAHQYYGY